MFILRLTIAAIALTFGMTGVAAPVVETLYDGSASPTAQGWSVEGEGMQIRRDGTTEFVTVDNPQWGSQYYLFKRDTRAVDYIASIRLKVISSSYNPFDAGITFSPFGDVSQGVDDRVNNFMIGNGIVLWGDTEGGTVSLDTSVFHEYAFRDSYGKLELFIDASFDDIVAGTATPVLSRTVAPTNPRHTGYLVWGDATNDLHYNSNYVVDHVKFLNLGPILPIPEPSTYVMFCAGVAIVLRRIRRRMP